MHDYFKWNPTAEEKIDKVALQKTMSALIPGGKKDGAEKFRVLFFAKNFLNIDIASV